MNAVVGARPYSTTKNLIQIDVACVTAIWSGADHIVHPPTQALLDGCLYTIKNPNELNGKNIIFFRSCPEINFQTGLCKKIDLQTKPPARRSHKSLGIRHHKSQHVPFHIISATKPYPKLTQSAKLCIPIQFQNFVFPALKQLSRCEFEKGTFYGTET